MKRSIDHPLRALVLEDEWPARNYLVELLEGSGLAKVVGAIASVDEAQAVLAAKSGVSVDVVFVDVQLMPDGEGAGLELVRELSRTPDAPLFVLATAFREHALEAFELGVADYLIKPFTEERVEACLERLHARRSRSDTQPPPPPLRIVARRGRGLVFLDPSEVWAFEAADRLTSVHTAHGTFDVDLSLSAIEASLGRSFARVHRNWLVNASHIKRLDRDGSETTIFVGVALAIDDATPGDRPVDYSNGLTVPVARERAQGVREMLLSNAMGVRRA
ncbi:MAG TPA: LytTR family DNA-binding domain-containing protein [Labilithrix sp.]|jgi:DNA-binding LytR/AlgR family response regulator|nr:LytTR family DNA-binding domain-containing protein [Labilithrix sp.]